MRGCTSSITIGGSTGPSVRASAIRTAYPPPHPPNLRVKHTRTGGLHPQFRGVLASAGGRPTARGWGRAREDGDGADLPVARGVLRGSQPGPPRAAADRRSTDRADCQLVCPVRSWWKDARSTAVLIGFAGAGTLRRAGARTELERVRVDGGLMEDTYLPRAVAGYFPERRRRVLRRPQRGDSTTAAPSQPAARVAIPSEDGSSQVLRRDGPVRRAGARTASRSRSATAPPPPNAGPCSRCRCMSTVDAGAVRGSRHGRPAGRRRDREPPVVRRIVISPTYEPPLSRSLSAERLGAERRRWLRQRLSRGQRRAQPFDRVRFRGSSTRPTSSACPISMSLLVRGWPTSASCSRCSTS